MWVRLKNKLKHQGMHRTGSEFFPQTVFVQSLFFEKALKQCVLLSICQHQNVVSTRNKKGFCCLLLHVHLCMQHEARLSKNKAGRRSRTASKFSFTFIVCLKDGEWSKTYFLPHPRAPFPLFTSGPRTRQICATKTSTLHGTYVSSVRQSPCITHDPRTCMSDCTLGTVQKWRHYSYVWSEAKVLQTSAELSRIAKSNSIDIVVSH